MRCSAAKHALWSARALLICAVILAAVQARADSPVAPASTAGRWHEASLDEYHIHLQALTALVETCAKARDMKACDPVLVGADDRILLGNGADRRLVRYGWLRILLSKAQDKDTAGEVKGAPGADAARPLQPTTTELLRNAATRLRQDITSTNAAAAPAHGQEREAMKQVLAGHDFRDLAEPSARDRAMEKLGNWLNHIFDSAAKLRARAAWLGRAIVWGFMVAACVGLAWGLMQMERRWRIRLVPENAETNLASAAARDWQLWLEDARKAAAAGLWREAIHGVYWAAVSRLEARRLWPADKARTPREYLALVAAEDPRRPGLAALTGSFERTWYGGRQAAEADFRKAEQLATGLISGSRTQAAGGGAER